MTAVERIGSDLTSILVSWRVSRFLRFQFFSPLAIVITKEVVDFGMVESVGYIYRCFAVKRITLNLNPQPIASMTLKSPAMATRLTS